MTLRSTELIIGASVFNTLDEEYEIAWHLNPDHCGCGYMKEAVDALRVTRNRGERYVVGSEMAESRMMSCHR